MSWLKLISGVVSLVTFLLNLWNSERWKQQGRDEVISAENAKEAENARKTSEILASSRSPDDTASRLRDGSF